MPELSFEIEKTESLWDKVGMRLSGLPLHTVIKKRFLCDTFVQTASLTKIDRKELATYLFIFPLTLSRRARAGKLGN